MPAFFNGVFGHKPSRFRVPNEGSFPHDPRDDPYLSTGPICRYASDLIPMLSIMAGEEFAKEMNLHSEVDLNRMQLKVFR